MISTWVAHGHGLSLVKELKGLLYFHEREWQILETEGKSIMYFGVRISSVILPRSAPTYLISLAIYVVNLAAKLIFKFNY